MASRAPPLTSRIRFATSAISAWILNLNMFGVSLRSVCSPGMNCHGCPWATAACPVGVTAYGLGVRSLPVLAIGTVLAIGVVTGRLVCAFVCPFGLLQEALYRIPARKIALPRTARYLKYAALVLLVVAFPLALGFSTSGYLAVERKLKPQADALRIELKVRNLGNKPVRDPAINVVYRDRDSGAEVFRHRQVFKGVTVPTDQESGEPIALRAFTVPDKRATAGLFIDSPQSIARQTPRLGLYYCKVCPVGALTATLPSHAGADTTSMFADAGIIGPGVLLLAAFLALMVVASRPYCRMFCPLGAVYGLLGRVALARIAVDREACASCAESDRCNEVCPVEIDVKNEAGGAECIACGECTRACPEGAVKRKFGL